jgi:hypothetical protein
MLIFVCSMFQYTPVCALSVSNLKPVGHQILLTASVPGLYIVSTAGVDDNASVIPPQIPILAFTLRAVLFEVGFFLKRLFSVLIVAAFKVGMLCESSTLVPAQPQEPVNALVPVLPAAGGAYRLQLFFFNHPLVFLALSCVILRVAAGNPSRDTGFPGSDSGSASDLGSDTDSGLVSGSVFCEAANIMLLLFAWPAWPPPGSGWLFQCVPSPPGCDHVAVC